MEEQEHTSKNTLEAKPGATPEAGDDLKSLPMSDLQAKLGSSPEGLSQAEAEKRLTHYGPNELEEKKTNPFLKFLTYFWGPIPWMIEPDNTASPVFRVAGRDSPVSAD